MGGGALVSTIRQSSFPINRCLDLDFLIPRMLKVCCGAHCSASIDINSRQRSQNFIAAPPSIPCPDLDPTKVHPNKPFAQGSRAHYAPPHLRRLHHLQPYTRLPLPPFAGYIPLATRNTPSHPHPRQYSNSYGTRSNTPKRCGFFCSLVLFDAREEEGDTLPSSYFCTTRVLEDLRLGMRREHTRLDSLSTTTI